MQLEVKIEARGKASYEGVLVEDSGRATFPESDHIFLTSKIKPDRVETIIMPCMYRFRVEMSIMVS